MTLVHKAVTAEVTDDLEFVLSDGTVDRYGDVIEADGWDLRWFKRNPIALFGHNSNAPIGTWDNVRVEGGKLLGRLKFAAEGTSERIDELRRLVEQKVLKAVSVGFKPIDSEPIRDKDGAFRGIRFLKQELLETSLVSVPANPAALAVARSMHISDDTMRLAFGEQAQGGQGRGRGSPGEHAASPLPSRMKTMRLGEKIQAAEAALVQDKDALTALVAKDDADPVAIDELTARIEDQETALAALKRAETALATRAASEPPAGSVAPGSAERRPFAIPAKTVKPHEYMLRAAAIKLVAHITRQPVDAVRERLYGNDEATKAVADMVTRAASAVATTTTSGWASQLVQTVYADFMDTLMPASVYPGLAARGLRLTFGQGGSISIPYRVATSTIAGSFVGEGSPIPVRQGAFGSVSLTPKKMAVISAFTREIAEHSTPAIEGLIRNAIQEDTSVALDTVLLDATAASAIRPAGLRNGVTVTTATSGGGIAALVGDVKALLGAIMTGSNNNLRAPVWIMNPAQALSASLIQNAGGDFVFADEIGRGTFRGFPLIVSPTVTAGMVILVDAADFATVTGDEPRFDVSDQATLHMEDTTPLAIGTAGSPNTVAAPVRSLFQTDSLALRMIMPVNWMMRRSGVVAWTESVTW